MHREKLNTIEVIGLSFIEKETACTLKKLISLTGITEQKLVYGLEELKQKGLIGIGYENSRIKSMILTEKGQEFCSFYL
jgi:predicted transcriptional regulator